MAKKKLKVVLHCQSSKNENDAFYGNNGAVHLEIEKKFGEKISFVGFGGYLAGENLNRFLKECEDADVVIVDAWTHPEDRDWYGKGFEPEKTMASVARSITAANPKAVLFADLLEGTRKVAVHKYAMPIHSWTDDCIITALRSIKKTAK